MVAQLNSVLANGGDGEDPAYFDCLIVGTGPAGGALACFLAQNGMKGLMINQDPGNADTPRAHITNMAALDCLRDVGLDKECYAMGTGSQTMLHTRWSNSFAGQEYCRIHSWGNDPARKGDYELASPSEPLDLPQTLLEPILTRYATLHGFHARFDTSFVSFEQTADPKALIRSRVHDRVSGQTYHVHSKYLFGADGARSQIARQLELPMIKQPSQGFAVNILIEADMSHLMENRMGNLHWLLTLDKEAPDYAWIGCIRMVKPWHEWLCIIFAAPGTERKVRPAEDYLPRIRDFIGDDSVDVQIKGISTWVINESAAEVYSRGNVFCLGDAVHRHPPNHGLGSNTCIQDAHNLAWKVAYVERSWAGPELLDSYNDERQPVGLDVVTQANASLRNHAKIWQVLGQMEETVNARLAVFNQLSEDSERGRQRRAALQEAVRMIHREEQGLGIEQNQRYNSNAILTTPGDLTPTFDTDPLEYYHATTYPGARLPHVWLSRTVPSKAVSTVDLAGGGRFALFTGIGGDGWRAAARRIEKEMKIQIGTFQIGFGQEWEDRYMRWEKLRGVEESGCVLVRPDRFVAWRSLCSTEHSEADLVAALTIVLSRGER
ncbi:hypothetical protein LTR56_007225 [Elasticomyces elasticus]|nr:hypothetical protein LTR56_007225 [Elasticomyces elasticus]KAK3663044.1 hypothetical protein LTR22_006208 [Elasticomyces elasticus]KAK4914479.1 hypothetical protein LTR49_017284 [Elasticomyces elasticus]KAK5753479.1 hypothetical protein LTS12_016431 [Elasticomyces elasticus]